jgi:hypothetical protein
MRVNPQAPSPEKNILEILKGRGEQKHQRMEDIIAFSPTILKDNNCAAKFFLVPLSYAYREHSRFRPKKQYCKLQPTFFQK